ncbi:MAG TPA: DUF3488 and transglutaminase-like domain-containing protein [Pyrinomonadaceae bacterium]|nr:DUF3488 and transglutaminase-like domain-containing protein [Pyrinomonadaceae bacterium]
MEIPDGDGRRARADICGRRSASPLHAALSSIKLLQVKADRDWLFLYLISFFEVLLAAGLGLGPAFLAALALHVFCALLAVVCFELRRSSRLAPESESRLLVANDYRLLRRAAMGRRGGAGRALSRLPFAAACLFLLIFALALPVFFLAPRASGSGLTMPGGAGSTGYVGFSDRVTLGDIGRLQSSNQLVMRVRVEGPGASQNLRWRGVALDHFDGKRWTQTPARAETKPAYSGDLVRLGTTEDLGRLTTQTFFLEAIDTPVLFAAPRAVAVQGPLPYVRRDGDDGLSSRPHDQERLTYRVFSDTFEPTPERLRADRMPDPRGATPNLRRDVRDYLQLPETLDTRIASHAYMVWRRSGARNVYDAARAIEAHLSQNAYGGDYSYSLDMRATGPDPLSDFLFNVRSGHCEYFSSAMVVMLRTLRIPARVVNGFGEGEYNEASGAYVVRQADAHSWVEVYFPESDAWVTFDPTPVSGRPAGASGGGLAGQLRRYADALDLFWLQYVVAYDKQGQRSLARTIRSQFNQYRFAATRSADGLWAALSSRAPGASGAGGSLLAVVASPLVYGPGAALLGLGALLVLRGKGFKLRGSRARAGSEKPAARVVEFYARMSAALEARGLRRRDDQTPREFAEAVGSPEVLKITEAYHRVRFGSEKLTGAEAAEVERCLRRVESSAVAIQ